MWCLHIASIIKSPEKNKEMDPKCRMWDIYVWLRCFHPEPVAQAGLSEHSHSPGGREDTTQEVWEPSSSRDCS